jgi:hypothetical protein
MKLRFPLLIGLLGVVISFASFAYTTLDANHTFTEDGNLVAVDTDRAATTPETFAHAFIRDAIVVLNPGIILTTPFSHLTETGEDDKFTTRLWLFTFVLNFSLYFLVGYLFALIFQSWKAKGKITKAL